MKKVAVLGSTGSIGTQTLDVVRANDDLEVVGLAAGRYVNFIPDLLQSGKKRQPEIWQYVCRIWM